MPVLEIELKCFHYLERQLVNSNIGYKYITQIIALVIGSKFYKWLLIANKKYICIIYIILYIYIIKLLIAKIIMIHFIGYFICDNFCNYYLQLYRVYSV